MEKMTFEYQASHTVKHRAHVGVVGSGDLEVLLEPSEDHSAHVTIRTSVDGFQATWKAVLDRFFQRYQQAANIEINDSGATPGVVMLRLAQAVEESQA
ncbi:malonate decarboxylase subunit delta [Ktedonospora formicarum]|uniref:Malonate decarboxylase acyl carrier protein n=1 Tax=Ktedonospora formicarum TaxID=2778364 RepID=A0A8J3I993_9CHLR|nr:malonate decarboxylase subunit delta [Ktedonospora formicarum]GHO50991.1 malonate decarboxylase acyl carrier protein [Ktedonospora formicarum]